MNNVDQGQGHNVVMAGTGGRGVLLAARTLALAAASRYTHVSWLPSYAVSQRGGHCECTVVFSQSEIASPLVLRAEAVVIFDSTQLPTYQHRVLPGGKLVLESTDVSGITLHRGDIDVVQVPALRTAAADGDVATLNFILLGAYLHATGALPPGLVEAEIRSKYASRNGVLEKNLRALRKGLDMVC